MAGFVTSATAISRQPRRTAASAGIKLPVLLPTYTAHRARTESDYASVCSRFPTTATGGDTYGGHGDRPHRVYFGAAAAASSAGGFVTSMMDYGGGVGSGARSRSRRPPEGEQLAADVGRRGRRVIDLDADDAGNLSDSSAEADSAGVPRRRRHLDPWRLCGLLRLGGVGDPRETGAAPAGRRVDRIRFHSNGTSVASWFANRDSIYAAAAASAASAMKARAAPTSGQVPRCM